MSFFNRLFGRQTAQAAPAPAPAPAPTAPGFAEAPATAFDVSGAPETAFDTAEAPQGEALPSTSDLLRGISERIQQDEDRPDIWDVEDTPLPMPAPAAPGPARKTRAKTRLLGFDSSEDVARDIMSTLTGGDETDLEAEEAAPEAPQITFPAGWVVVTAGPGRGAHFPLISGLSSIGRGADQTVRLDFGDMSISRAGHAAIAYDADTHEFVVGQGGKSNIVRLNGRPVIANETLSDGDRIRVGETELRLTVLCGADFDWSEETDAESGEDGDDLEIA